MKDMLSQGASMVKRQCILVEGDLVINVLTADGGGDGSPRRSIRLEGPVLLTVPTWQELTEQLAALGRQMVVAPASGEAVAPASGEAVAPPSGEARGSGASGSGALVEVEREVIDGKLIEGLMPIFRNERVQVMEFLHEIRGAKAGAVTSRVNELLAAGVINPSLCHKLLWSILHEHGFYSPHEEQLESAHHGSPQASP